MAIITYPLNGFTYDAENAETYLCTRKSGVFSADDNFQASVSGSREITISKGLAWIQNAEFHGKSVCSTESVVVNVPISDGTNGRIDRIVLRFDKASNESTIELLQGTPSSNPVAPDVTQTEELYELGLCTVNVGASAVSLNATDITSTLLDEDVCGLMRDAVTEIPTAQLQEQVYELLDVLRSEISDAENGTYVTVGEYRDLAEITLTTGGWSSSSPYEQTVTVQGLTEDSACNIGIIYPSGCTRSEQKAINKAAGYIYEIETGWDSITFRATQKPATNIPLGLRGCV